MSFVSGFCAFASHEPHTHHHSCSHAHHHDHGQGSGHDHGHEEERLLATSKLLEELTEEEDKSCTDLDFISTIMSILVLCSCQFLAHVKEVILDDRVAKALLEYINCNYLNSIVVGASTRNALTRKFKIGKDVSSSLVNLH